MGIFKHEGLRIVGRHIVAWDVRVSPVQLADSTEKKMQTIVWTTSSYDEGKNAWVLAGDHDAALTAAVGGE